MALARLRQLSAHEVGHTLGFAHNYYDSSAGRISVMDYPHPLVTLRADGTIDLSDAYAIGIGEWDKVAVRWGYGDRAGADERRRSTHPRRGRGRAICGFLADQDPAVSPARRSVGQRHRPGSGAAAHDARPARRARSLRRDRHPPRHAAGDAGGGARAAVPAPSLPGGGRRVGDRRPVLHLRAARRRRAGAARGAGRRAAGRARGAGRHAGPVRAGLPRTVLGRCRRARPATRGTASCSRATPA